MVKSRCAQEMYFTKRSVGKFFNVRFGTVKRVCPKCSNKADVEFFLVTPFLLPVDVTAIRHCCLLCNTKTNKQEFRNQSKSDWHTILCWTDERKTHTMNKKNY